jgi:hypothetical protein
MGWFGSYALGAIAVAAPKASTDGGASSGSMWPDARRHGLAWAKGLGRGAVPGGRRTMRRRPTVPA